MDFGFGAFLEKFEEHFGPRVLKALLLLMGLAVALVCAKLIWDTAFGPLVKLISASLHDGKTVDAIAKAFAIGMGFVAGVGIAGIIATNLASWRVYKKGQELLERTDRLQSEVEQRAIRADSILERANEFFSLSTQMMDEVKIIKEKSERDADGI